MTRLQRSSPDERRTPTIEIVAVDQPMKYRLKWKPWPDLLVPLAVFAGLFAWLGWIVWSVFA